jgi:hypothetical protein
MIRTLKLATCFAWLALATSSQAADVIVPAGSEWKWLHPTDGTDPAKSVADFHKTFMKADFDDAKWNTAKDSAGKHGGFAYGEEGFTGQDIGTPDPENRKSAYFRHKFKTEKGFKDLVLKLQRDDGVIIYLDGKEVGRDGMGGGDEKFDLYSEQTIGGDDETKVAEVKLEGSLEPGEHILAISLHNRPNASSDLRIGEISLEGTAK